jgi:hypothetical protein
MNDLSRRKLIVSGIAATAGVSGLAVAARIAQKYGLVPPDHGGLYGPGETLTYASQRLLTRHSLAREFPRSKISNPPLANEMPPLTEAFKRHQAAAFADWRRPRRPPRLLLPRPAEELPISQSDYYGAV